MNIRREAPTTIYIGYDSHHRLFPTWKTAVIQNHNVLKYVLISEPIKLKDTKPEFDETIKWFCEKFKTTVEIIFSKSSCNEIVAMRYSLIWYLKEENDLLPQEMEDCFGIDRTLFYHIIKTVNNAIETKNKFYIKYFNI